MLYFLEKYSSNWNSVREHVVIQLFENGLYAVQHFVLLTTMIPKERLGTKLDLEQTWLSHQWNARLCIHLYLFPRIVYSKFLKDVSYGRPIAIEYLQQFPPKDLVCTGKMFYLFKISNLKILLQKCFSKLSN